MLRKTFLVTGLVALGLIAQSLSPPPHAPVATAHAASEPRVLWHDTAAARLINAYRSRHGLKAVRTDSVLAKIAARHALDLARNGKTGHYGSDGSDPADRAVRGGYKYLTLGENASAGRTELGDVINAWIRSPTHQPNMVLDPATDFGLAHVVAPGTRYGHYWILMVGKRRPQEPARQSRDGSRRNSGDRKGGSLFGNGELGNGFTGGFFGPRRVR